METSQNVSDRPAMIERSRLFQAGLKAVGSNPSEGLIEVRDGASICDLKHYAMLAFEGPDAENFLHGQLSSDVHALTSHCCQPSTYNSPKGRVLATLLLWRTADGFLAQLPADIAESVRRKLAMFVLRSKVRIELASERFIRIGVCGPTAAAVVAACGMVTPREEYGMIRGQTLACAAEAPCIDMLLRLPGNRYELFIADVNAALSAWSTLVARGAEPAQEVSWHWATVQSGIVEIGAQTQDQFVAQMLNYELVGGISFTKGCYPGQEIIARTQYRGEIKRRTFLAHIESNQAPTPAEGIFDQNTPDQAIGSVVNVAPAPAGGYDLLVCLYQDLAISRNLRVGNAQGPRLELLASPYALQARA